ncbi:MAG TPA: TonB family protein [Terriglobia bacterium]|nr:TonB family protein [Terriglobia bacterium]
MKLLRLICAAVFAIAGLATWGWGEEAKWVEAQSPHFLLFTDTTEAKGRRLLEDLEGRVAALAKVVGRIPERQFPVEVFLFDKGQDFTEVTGPEPEHSAYLYRGPDRVFVVARDKSPEDIANDVGHALGHVFFERTTLWRPFWLSEGAAEYFRKAGRKPDTKSVPREEAFTARDLLRIVASPSYRDSDPGGASRTQSHRLLRLIKEKHHEALDPFLEALRIEGGGSARIDLDTDQLQDELDGYAETAVPLEPRPENIRSIMADNDRVAIHWGDLFLAARKYGFAGEQYSGADADARAARAILIRFTRNPIEASRALERATREIPDVGLAQFHFGSVEVDSPPDLIAAQALGLERAVAKFPLLGRAKAELARVYTLQGRAADALPLIEAAIAEEPEFADHFYDIQAQALVALRRLDDAYRAIKTSAALPHIEEKVDTIYEQKIKTLGERVETIRRNAEAERVEQIRRQVDQAVDLTEPPPPPPPPPEPTRVGNMSYTIESIADVSVINKTYPEFPRVLLDNGVGGTITFEVTVGPDGRVTRVEAVKSDLPELNNSTAASLRRWTFSLASQNGQTSGFKMKVTFHYDVEEISALPGLR